MLIVAGKFEEAQGAGTGREVPRLDPEAGPEARRHVHRGAAAGRRADGRRSGASATVGVGRRGLPHAGRRPPGLGAAEPARRHHLAVAERPALQGPGRVEAGHQRARPGADNAHDPGLFFAVASGRPGQARRRPRRAGRDAGDPRRHAVHRPTRWTRRRSAASGTPSMLQSNSPGDGPGPQLGVGTRRLAAAVHPARPDCGRHGRRREPGGAGRTSRSPTARSACTSRRRSRRGWRCRRPRPSTSLVKDYKGGTVGAAGEAFDPSPANLDARLKVVDQGGMKAGLLAEEEPRRDRVARADPALRQRGVAQGADDRGRDAARADDGRDQEARPAGAARGVGLARHRISPGVGGFGGRGGGARRGRRGRHGRASSRSPSRPSATRCRRP